MDDNRTELSQLMRSRRSSPRCAANRAAGGITGLASAPCNFDLAARNLNALTGPWHLRAWSVAISEQLSRQSRDRFPLVPVLASRHMIGYDLI